MSTGFIKVKCAKCKNEQTIFEKPAMVVSCLVCGEVLSESTGGKGALLVKQEVAEKGDKGGKNEKTGNAA